jgi:hypothetical protein
MTIYPTPQADSLSPEKLQLFSAALAGLPREEIRKAKVLYVRNAIAEYKAATESMKAFGCAMVLFALIPIFWPFLIAQRRTMNAQRRMLREKLRNVMEVWRDDLQAERFDLDVDPGN